MAHYTDRLLWLVKRAEMATHQAKEHTLRQHGITAAQHAALTILSLHDGMTSAELARRCFVTPQTMNSTVSRLEAADLVDRSTHAVHRNLIELRLTAHGRQVFERADAAISALDHRLVEDLAPAELDTLSTMLVHITNIAEQSTANAPNRNATPRLSKP